MEIFWKIIVYRGHRSLATISYYTYVIHFWSIRAVDMIQALNTNYAMQTCRCDCNFFSILSLKANQNELR